MTFRRWFPLLLASIVCSAGVARAATDPGVNSTDDEAFSPTTDDPGGINGTVDPTGVTPTEEGEMTTPDPGLNSTVNGTLFPTEETSVTTEAPGTTSVPPPVTPKGCPCDLMPDFCDIGCCCDTLDCAVANLSTVFTGCPQKAISGVCVERWLMFRANVDSSLVTVTDSLFCVQSEADDAVQSIPAVSHFPSLGASYHFSPPEPTITRRSYNFYKVDDVIQTYFSDSSVRGLLRQPSPGAAALSCVNRNPAKFLRSVSLSCTRKVTSESCATDPTLSARSYSSAINLIKIPIGEGEPVSDFLVPVTPLADWPTPTLQNNSCVNAVTEVEYVIGYTGRGEVVHATVNVVLADLDLNRMLLQKHSTQFQLATPRPTLGPMSPVGLLFGSPVIGRFDTEVKPLTSLGVSQGGKCSSDPGEREPILFARNIITGCKFSAAASDCSQLLSEIYGVLQGLAVPDVVAMNSGSQPDWTRVMTQECSVDPEVQETCETGCTVPLSLSIQILWARQGLIELPQNFILGARYLFHCKKVKCAPQSPLTLTTEVTFADTTVYPEPPRGRPQPHWKFPFSFFTRGYGELDGHFLSGSDAVNATWTLMLLAVVLLAGL